MSLDGEIKEFGDTLEYPFYLRSCAKPLQAALLIDEKLDEELGLTSEEIAIGCASHAGEDCHVQTAKSFTVSNDSEDKFYYYDCTQRNLTELLYKFVYKTSGLKDLFGNLNVSYNEMRKGVHYTDPDREKISFTSRYNSPDWRNDFIDLDALINNVVRDCIRESREAE